LHINCLLGQAAVVADLVTWGI